MRFTVPQKTANGWEFAQDLHWISLQYSPKPSSQLGRGQTTPSLWRLDHCTRGWAHCLHKL